jgi:ribosomal RNA-processing protein 17
VTGFHKRKKKRRKEAQKQIEEKERRKRIIVRKKVSLHLACELHTRVTRHALYLN